MGSNSVFGAVFVVIILGAAVLFYIGINEDGDENGSKSDVYARLPEERYRMAVAYDSLNGYVYLFGGRDFNGTSDPNGTVSRNSIFRFSVTDGTATQLDATLPLSLDGATAAWMDGRAYIFGGYHEGLVQDSIIVFNPGEGTDGAGATAEVMDVRAPVGFQGGYCAYDGEDTIYYTGGHSADMQFQDTVMAFTPDPRSHLEGTVTDSGMKMPSGRAGAAALWIDGYMYVFGGRNPKMIYHDVVRLDPETRDVRVFDVPMPEPRYHHCAAYDEGTDTVYIFGGRNGNSLLDSVDAFRFETSSGGTGETDEALGEGADGTDGETDGTDGGDGVTDDGTDGTDGGTDGTDGGTDGVDAGSTQGPVCIPGGSSAVAGGLIESCSLTEENALGSPGRFVSEDWTVPTPRERLAAVAVPGAGIYVFGGQEALSSTDEILLFSP